jgi:hypothetical protein
MIKRLWNWEVKIIKANPVFWCYFSFLKGLIIGMLIVWYF